MKPFLTFCLSFWVLIVFADPSHPKAQRGKVTFLSSEMWSDVTSESKKYPVRNIVDNNPLTAWVFEPNASSQKEVIGMAMVFSESLMIDGIRIINGYAKSEYLYKANSSIESFELILSTGETIKYECSKSLEEQKFQFAAQELDWIILVVKNIRQGTKYTDLCISELTVTFDGANIIKESQDVIITNEGGEYESDKIYTLKNEMKFDTGIWDFGCGSHGNVYNSELGMLAYYDGCNDNGRISILDLNSMTTSNFENVMWVDNWVVGIKSEFELIISDGKSTFSFDTNKQIKNSTPIGKPRYKKSLWNWTRNLEKFKK